MHAQVRSDLLQPVSILSGRFFSQLRAIQYHPRALQKT
jgi:hypothetical protein